MRGADLNGGGGGGGGGRARPGDAGQVLRAPTVADGAAIHALVAACPPLDLNSLYAYLLLCEHFRATCIVAEGPAGIDAFVSAYIPPATPDTLFIWQVAVHQRARGRGLAGQLLMSLLDRPAVAGVRHLETTVAPENAASRRTFARLAHELHAPLTEQSQFDANLFGDAEHDEERLLRIGPFTRALAA